MSGTRRPPADDAHSRIQYLRSPTVPYEPVASDDTATPYTSYHSVNGPFESTAAFIPPRAPSSFQSKEQPPAPEKSKSFFVRGTGWRPATLKLPFLLSFALVTVVLIIVAELAIRRSQSHGALVFASETKSGVEYLLNYGPLAVGVLYGLLFVSVDHDVKR
jgi:hypothetical protein